MELLQNVPRKLSLKNVYCFHLNLIGIRILEYTLNMKQQTLRN